ncbi:hypothetical protein [Pseudarthrobacter sp. NS4]|uniref:DUF7793 family protein n=1 Tax=Pseudarthrobacter sp. NS4 TaxID=2973976 RepID=UPI0021611C13|nr:hypothetical protein [Pseudarthrobacter sp. NS4]
MPEVPQEDRIGKVELREGFVHLCWSPGAWIDEDAARAMMIQASEFCAGRRLPLLVEMAGLKGLDHRAGAIFAAEWSFTRTAIVGSSPVDEIIATFYMARHHRVYPTQFFFSLSDARVWLQEHDPADCSEAAQAHPNQAPAGIEDL